MNHTRAVRVPSAPLLDEAIGLLTKATLDSRSVVIVMSDGYDTDPPEALAVELKRLKRRAHRLVWEGYAPVARSMAIALGYVDSFVTAHSLASLAALEDKLARL